METEKLKLEHLAPYLPYALKIVHSKTGDIFELGGILPQSGGAFHMCALIKDGNDGGFINLIVTKPILRPMSDLFNDNLNPIPINELQMKYGWDYLFYDVYKKKEPFNINSLKYACLIKLIEWHFDVFSLIEKKLAISIHDIQK